jgi:HD-GYP domain-containing protein (c-di-GMP phosphodiesterase class II)
VIEKGATAILKKGGAGAVCVGHIARAAEPVEAPAIQEEAVPSEEPAEPEFLHMSAATISALYAEAAEGKTDLDIARSMLSNIKDLVSSGHSSIEQMLNMKSHDDYTYTHIVNVCVLTMAQACRLNLRDEVLDDIGLAALMHDLGKQRVPGDIIRKPSRLTNEEFQIMKKHTIYGAEMLHEMPGAPPLTAMVAFEHHLKYDCTGYPEVRRRRELNLCTYLTTIADAFDAMRTLRPYSRQMTQEEVALRMAKDAGTHFEPGLLNRFFRILDLFNTGSKVLLNTGEEAVVVKKNHIDCMKPTVRLSADSEGNAIEGGRTIDLARKEGPDRIYIEGVPEPESEEDGGAAAA